MSLENGRVEKTVEASIELTDRLKLRTSLLFAIATSLAALTLAGNPDTELLPVIACFFAAVGFVFVDWLKWFSLPPTAAYLSLGAIAMYSVTRFPLLWGEDMSVADDMQMVLVAELLVMVQAVLMLQRKNRRIFEQLAIFCLLELVVAAIFNDAISYGLLLLPLGLVGAAALAMLQTQAIVDEAFVGESPTPRSASVGRESRIVTAAVGAEDSFRRSGLALPKATTTVLAPAVLMIAALFFYGLPRTNPTGQGAGGRRALVGFSESIQLGQIGRLLQSDKLVMKIELDDQRSGKPYTAIGRLYLRGAVLEQYHAEATSSGSWSVGVNRDQASSVLPDKVEPTEGGWAADEVRVRITTEATSTAALFAIAPYHRPRIGGGVDHQELRWLLRRQVQRGLMRLNRFEYQFGTTAFRNGMQTRLVPWVASQPDANRVPEGGTGGRPVFRSSDSRTATRRPWLNDPYVWDCLVYDYWALPSVRQLSDRVVRGQSLNPLQTALALERYLSTSPEFEYTLDLTAERDRTVDPIERFLTTHRRGTCQHFGSALALMLRSQGIPSRLVVGYSTGEFNSLGGYYVARQLHAHVWVEALIAATWIRPGEMSGGSPTQPADAYWVRLDPTPGGGGVRRPAGGRVSEAFDLAHNFWTDYVVERGALIRQGDGIEEASEEEARSFLGRAMQVAKGWFTALPSVSFVDLARRVVGGFSWRIAVLAMLIGGCVISIRAWWPAWFRVGWRLRAASQAAQPEPTERFFAETLRLLGRVGIHRSMGQTPLELTDQAAEELIRRGGPPLAQPLRRLTEAFYHIRFRAAGRELSTAPGPTPEELEAALDAVRSAVRDVRSQSTPHPTST